VAPTAGGIVGLARQARSGLLAALDLALPAECAGCGLLPGLLCRRCGLALAEPARPAWPQPSPPGLPPPWAVADYDGAVRAALLAHKEQGRAALARPLGAALATAVRAALAAAPPDGQSAGGGVVLVPMPSRRGAVRERGRDPTLAIARAAARSLRAEGRDVSVRPVLRMAGSVQDQSGLDAHARAANLQGAVLMADRPGVALARQCNRHGTRVVLVDDIVTTGASLAAAAATLRGSGIDVVGAALVAATRRRTTPGLLPVIG
jgi:predicted amidophosphoribosyltransferase